MDLLFKGLVMGPIIFSNGNVKVYFTRPFLLLDKVSLTNSWKGIVNVSLCFYQNWVFTFEYACLDYTSGHDYVFCHLVIITNK